MQRSKPEIVEVDHRKLEALLERAEQMAFETEDYETIRAVLESYFYVTNLIDQKSTTLARLRKLLFGDRTEKTSQVIGQPGEASGAGETGESSAPSTTAEAEPQQADASGAARSKRKGHGRNGADDYPGAIRIEVSLESLSAGDACPECLRGTVYEVAQPSVLIRFIGQAPVQATVYQLQKLRCGLCGKLFTAEPPAGVGVEKYDATVASMIGLLKYGSGLPFNRNEGLQRNLEIPLPASTQWEIVSAPLPKLEPAYEELIRQAAQGEVVYNDDTTVKILERMGVRAEQAAQRASLETHEQENGQPHAPERKGTFTSGVISACDGRRIALFFSGGRHAGENLQEVLRRRAADLGPPIQMCDALSRNLPRELETIVAHCLAHARRQFVDVHDRFPTECRYVLEALQVIYHNDTLARERKLSPEERLAFHQAESGPTMERLHVWLKRQFDERLVEPNSSLGAAINYLRKHWRQLTLFLQKAGAPLDNNVCERALKKAILHRKNSLFYKTQNGADAGDLYMSLIHTCELCGANPFDYLTQLQRHAAAVAATPQHWLPWNYGNNFTHASDAA
jgi:transposase